MALGHWESFPVAIMWRYENNQILSCGCVGGRTLIKHLKFGAEQTMYYEVTNMEFLMAKHLKNCCHTIATLLISHKSF